MAGPYRKSFDDPDELLTEARLVQRIVEIGGFTVGHVTHEPGWRWSEELRSLVGTELCEARHVGVVISGRLGVELRDGTKIEVGPREVYEIPPGHDAWAIGNEELISIDWSGLESWTGFRARLNDRVLAGLLMTDVVDSTAEASRVGDAEWRRRIAEHLEAIRSQLDRYRGREIDSAGDGIFATFDGAARALECAVAVRNVAERHGMRIRLGVHVGEVELTANGVRGLAVHEVARVMANAGEGEIFASESTKVLAGGDHQLFDDRGEHELKGLDRPRRLYSYAPLA
jgi:class 3 adenylate cyclase